MTITVRHARAATPACDATSARGNFFAGNTLGSACGAVAARWVRMGPAAEMQLELVLVVGASAIEATLSPCPIHALRAEPVRSP